MISNACLNFQPLPNPFFQFKQFTVHHDRCAMKVTTDGCLFGAWCSEEIRKGKREGQNLLDIGAGTGLLSLMMAQKNKVMIDAIEIDNEAVQQAKENITASPWKERIKLIHADVLQWKTDNQYDCIISNPPFYERELKSDAKTKNIAHHDEGLKLADLFRFIKAHLSEEGTFYLLLPAKRENEVNALLNSQGLYLHQNVIVRQSVHHSPLRMMLQAGTKKAEDIHTSEIAIKDSRNEYTPPFKDLLKDYYLYL